MTAPHADQLIDGYLARISAAAADFPAGARTELLDDMRSHIAEARSRERDETDATILNILDRLGEPAVVVAEARERLGLRAEPVARPGLLEIAAMVLLLFVWPVGLILFWVSPLWRTRDKIIGSIFTLGGYPSIYFVGAMFAVSHGVLVRGSGYSCGAGADSQGNVIPSTCTGPSVLDTIGMVAHAGLVVLLFLLPVLTVTYLAIQLRSQRRVMLATV
jgi:hypothetical protein